jgi:transcriptional regulator with XRE-family HTH domain
MNQPPTETPPPPEAVLIRRARGALSLSPEKAAPLADVIRASQWRNIEAGKSYAKDDVLAHMAYVVRVTPEELEEVDRVEAAQILRRILREREPGEPGSKLPVGHDFKERIARILASPEAMERAAELLRIAQIPEVEEKERRHRDTG